MSPVVLILAPTTRDRRYIRRKGDLFDTAFVETVRTLDGRGGGATVLVPWTVDLAALVVAATADTAPAFDPEAADPSGRTRSRLVPYLAPGEPGPEPDSPFWRASHLSLGGVTAVPFEAAMRQARPTHVIVLGPPRRPATFRRFLRGTASSVLTFGSLVSPTEATTFLGVPANNVLDLEAEGPVGVDVEETLSPEVPAERSSEVDLEPYVPFGLLLQNRLDEFLDHGE